MSPLSLELTRPKSVQTNSITPNIVVGSAVETDTSQEESFFIPINIQSQDPPSFTVASCTTTSSSTNVTTTGNFNTSGVKVGDVVTGTGIAASTTVSAIAANGQSLTLSQNATASGTVSLTFDPPNIANATLYALRVVHIKNGSNVSLNLELCLYDGSLGATAGTRANATTVIDLLPTTGTASIDFDAFLTRLRVPRLA